MKHHTRVGIFKTHGILAVAGFIALAAIGASSQSAIRASLTDTEPVITDIAVEHSEPATLGLNVSVQQGTGLVEITGDPQATLHISLPSEWIRREVRHAALTDIQPDPPTFGFTRWRFPPRAVVSFEAPEAPQQVLLHNPSKIVLRVNYVYVDLATEEVLHDMVLVQERATTLW